MRGVPRLAPARAHSRACPAVNLRGRTSRLPLQHLSQDSSNRSRCTLAMPLSPNSLWPGPSRPQNIVYGRLGPIPAGRWYATSCGYPSCRPQYHAFPPFSPLSPAPPWWVISPMNRTSDLDNRSAPNWRTIRQGPPKHEATPRKRPHPRLASPIHNGRLASRPGGFRGQSRHSGPTSPKPAHLIQNGRFGRPGGSGAFSPFRINVARKAGAGSNGVKTRHFRLKAELRTKPQPVRSWAWPFSDTGR